MIYYRRYNSSKKNLRKQYSLYIGKIFYKLKNILISKESSIEIDFDLLLNTSTNT